MILAGKIVNPDIIGVTASTLCFIHCVATPFIFVAKACSSTCCTEAPLWWKAVDFLFLAISFIAIYYTTKTSTKNWVKYALWVTWTLLLFVILNESLRIIVLPQEFIYFPAFSLIALHFYNLKYCNCAENKCCTNHQYH